MEFLFPCAKQATSQAQDLTHIKKPYLEKTRRKAEESLLYERTGGSELLGYVLWPRERLPQSGKTTKGLQPRGCHSLLIVSYHLVFFVLNWVMFTVFTA